MAGFLAHAGRSVANRVRIVLYEQLFGRPGQVQVQFGTFVFTCIGHSLGRRDPPSPARETAMRLHDGVVANFGAHRVLNDPSRSLMRLDLLRTLRAAGINRFAAYRVDEPAAPMRFPVFVRGEFGSLREPPALLHTRDELAAVAAVATGADAEPRVVIEYCEGADAEGFHRKYGAFVVGDRIVPRHLFKSRHWWVKAADIVDDATVEEELAYLATNPHEAQLLEVCRLANIRYGRIDYAVVDGRPQIWEINHTPQIIVPPRDDVPQRAPVHARFVEAFIAALEAIDPPAP